MSPLWRRARIFTFLVAMLLCVSPALAQESTPEATAETTPVATTRVRATATFTVEPTIEPTATFTSTATATATFTATPTATATPEPLPPFNVVGSGIVAPLLEALAEQAERPVAINVTGTNSGVTAFCAGEATAVIANRTLTPAEEINCATAGINFNEILLGHSVAAVIAHPDADFAVCYSQLELGTFFAPSATITNWTQVNPTNADVPLVVALPSASSSAYGIIDAVVEGDGLRADSAPLADDAAVVAAVSAEQGAIGVVSLEAALAAGDTVKLVQLDFGEAGCVPPSTANVESRSYNAAAPLMLYVNTSEIEPATAIADVAASEEAAQAFSALGFSQASAAVYTAQNEALASGTTGRVYSRVLTSFAIDSQATGNIRIGGATSAVEFVRNLGTAFTASYPTMTTNVNIGGIVAGARQFCNGEIDIVVTSSPLGDEQTANCEANNITPTTVTLGSQATVLLANGENTYLTCLTTTQLASVWSAASNDTITTWNQVDASFPDTAITLLAPAAGNSAADLLFVSVTGASDAGRADVNYNADPLYRAAAVGNVDGGLTLLSWSEYQTVLNNNQGNIQLVAVDNGEGCVVPSVETISDGSYAVSRPLNFTINSASLATAPVQAFLWFTFSDANFISLQNAGLIGIEFGDLREVRANLQELFTAAEAINAQAEAEATAEATDDATATEEAVEEATAEATETEATAEATAESGS